ncbi:hypothetical protein [Polluticaenibacter yanchengensis]|uniref:Uncharacterized protein n=1 Tax=Polluticaenibacter yanchengensis TaxID=3014562 RepID=A0ABT4UM12_9BACT|nr:hypothetical protein [Chitinophagaceae bacterium LY-5]
MQLYNLISQLDSEVLVDLHYIVEDRLIELKLIKDPYNITDKQLSKIVSDIDTQESRIIEEEPAEKETVLIEDFAYLIDAQDENDKIVNDLSEKINTLEHKDELFKIYNLTLDAVRKEELNYDKFDSFDLEDFKKLKGLD